MGEVCQLQSFQERITTGEYLAYSPTTVVTGERVCTLASKLARLPQRLGEGDVYAGVYVEDVTLDDGEGVCSGGERYPLLRTVHRLQSVAGVLEAVAQGGMCSSPNDGAISTTAASTTTEEDCDYC